ncbi:amidase [Hypoxylon sp. FL1150]|nr:amidase [Hypoxylon sp. FL1150]
MACTRLRTLAFAELGGSLYYVRARTEASLPHSQKVPSPSDIVPLVVIHSDSNDVSPDHVRKTIARFNEVDDVFQDDFATGSYLLIHINQGPLLTSEGPAQDRVLTTIPNHPSPDGLTDLLRERSLKLLVTKGPFTIPEGPYFMKGQEIHQAWRLFPDHLAAFTAAVIPDDHSEQPRAFTTLLGSYSWAEGGQIAVPSKLYSQGSNLPLAGMRISVKDNMHLKGVVTTLGNKAYAELYGKQDSSAKYIDSLIEQGAVIVGKTKLSAFAGSEIPPVQCIDYFPPWNPRGDGYQGPSGSSSGAGASVAGYDWLDISICTDTSGSMRHPTASHGLWGSKVTWGSVPMDGVVPACQFYDSFGILGRSPAMIERLIQASGIVVDGKPYSSSAKLRLNEDFLRDLETFTGIQHSKFSISDAWSKTCPEESAQINKYDNLHNFDEFRSEYQERFGKKAYGKCKKVTAEERATAVKQAIVFRKWALETLFENDPSVVMLVPHGRPGANYRDITNNVGGFGIPGGPGGPIFVISLLGVPQVVIPIGQNAYQSRPSGREETAPQFTSLISVFNTDLDLLRVAAGTLRASGRPTELLTGRYAYPQHDNPGRGKKDQGVGKAIL